MNGVDFSPKIDIIIANYNYSQYLAVAINSVLGQTYKDVNLIVVDDGSTDDSIAVIDSYKNVTSILKENGGQSSAIRAALSYVTGDIVMLLDSDDYLLPDACEKIARAWKPGISLVQFKLLKLNNHGALLGYYPDKAFLKADYSAFVQSHGYIPSSPTSGNAFSANHVREQFKFNKDRDRAYVDGYLIYTAALEGSVISLEAALAVYRVHGSNASLSSGRSRKSLLNQLRTNLSHAEGLRDALERKHGPNRHQLENCINSYTWTSALVLKKIGLGSELGPIAHATTLQLALYALSRTMKDRGISMFHRIRNTILILGALLSPGSLVGGLFVRD